MSEGAILPYARIPDAPGIYVCGCLERWVSIHLQAVRALNLAWALRVKATSGAVSAGARVCVIGGGFAGLSVAAGLGRGGAEVTLLEQNQVLLGAQRKNRVRWIHPHIHEWPRAGALDPRAGLPLLDWTAGLSADVAASVLAGFEAETRRSGIEVVLGAKPVVLGPGPTVGWSGRAPVAFDAVVLALGVGIEKSFGNLPLRSYWADEDIATVKDGPRRHHLVTGIGEGGVIDALYLRLGNFSHAEIARTLEASAGMREVEAALLDIEGEIAGMTDDAANALLSERYGALRVPAGVDEKLRARARPDTRVTLNGPEPFPLAARADVLNRFLIARLVAVGELDYVPGKVESIAIGDGGVGYRAEIAGKTFGFDEVNIRHGTVPAMRTAFPELWDRYQPARMRLPHLTPEPFWPPGFFE
jgi:Pyridine nucleotide-disulphide oxidoreductase